MEEEGKRIKEISYDGKGDPEISQKFKQRVNEFLAEYISSKKFKEVTQRKEIKQSELDQRCLGLRL